MFQIKFVDLNNGPSLFPSGRFNLLTNSCVVVTFFLKLFSLSCLGPHLDTRNTQSPFFPIWLCAASVHVSMEFFPSSLFIYLNLRTRKFINACIFHVSMVLSYYFAVA
jgi:hypothetical protein